MAEPTAKKERVTRRRFLATAGRGASLCALAGVTGMLAARGRGAEQWVWQIDPHKCTQCGRCQIECVLDQSAVRCVHDFSMCGYCKFCFGFFRDDAVALNEGAENQACPTGAIVRTFVEDPYFQYTIDEDLCIGCGKCVKGCNQFGNGSLYLQVRHDFCLNCSQCSIAVACASDAFVRVPARTPYFTKHKGPDELPSSYQLG
jgi:electron transport complex protein RnfB